MKKVILIRFGDTPNPAITNALIPHIHGKAMAFPAPGSIISIFETNSELSAIDSSVNQTGALYFLMDFETSVMRLPVEAHAAIDRKFGTDDHVELERGDRIYSMNELLDLINENGIDSLTPNQKQQLGKSLQ